MATGTSPVTTELSRQVIAGIAPYLRHEHGLPYLEILFILGIFSILVIFVIAIRKPH